MTEKYRIVGDDDIYEGFIAEGNLCDYLELEDVLDLLNELTKENNQLNKTIDEFIEVNHEHLKIITELRNEIKELKNKHKDDEFKLHTLETHYTCPHCEFNHKQFQYLRSLDEKRNKIR